MNADRFRLAASSYLNSAPLIWSFLYGPHQGSVDFIEAVPARCAQLLAESSVEGALVPVIEYQRIAGGALVIAGTILLIALVHNGSDRTQPSAPRVSP